MLIDLFLWLFSSLSILGVELLVDFTGRGHMKNIKSLSGGQKAVVGLVFILAIQVLLSNCKIGTKIFKLRESVIFLKLGKGRSFLNIRVEHYRSLYSTIRNY